MDAAVSRPKVQTYETKCARTVQRYWRNNFSKKTTAKIIQHLWEGVGFTPEHTPKMSFEALVVFLREKPVIAAMKAALQRIHILTTFLHGSPKKLSLETVNARVYNAAYMIRYHKDKVFESMGKLEQPLLEISATLLDMFHGICTKIMGNTKCFREAVPVELTADFPTTLFEYLTRFKTWKIPDEAKLTCRIQHALVALHQAEKLLPADEPEDSNLKAEFRTQTGRLREKLQQIAGKEALEKFDRELPERCKRPLGVGAGGAEVAAALQQGKMTNESLAHELLLDPTFLLDDSGGSGLDNPVFQRIRESFHRSFWDSLVDDLNLATPCYTRVLRVLAEIRDGIIDLAGERGAICEVLDVDFIKTRAEGGNYPFMDAAKMIKSVVGVIRETQSPRREEETGTKWKALEERIHTATVENGAHVMCACLEFLLDRVNAMRIDAANARFVIYFSIGSFFMSHDPLPQAPPHLAGHPNARH